MTVDEYTEETGISLLRIAGGYDDCIVGVDESHGRLVYDATQIVARIAARDQISEDEALEYFQYNIASAYLGTHTPVYIRVMQFDLPPRVIPVDEVDNVVDNGQG
jgi:hypothetical protein